MPVPKGMPSSRDTPEQTARRPCRNARDKGRPATRMSGLYSATMAPRGAALHQVLAMWLSPQITWHDLGASSNMA